ncbi:hypothetical protein PanWU01x14_285560 [Parasponia andersonii]|uniref:Uncharacterized protein n=1 Tax=Parasponia andersonii TaxID=3476 RepID=A0A2P5AZG2_PARAD|nr:hypothetical protein PanWU01x14_285560 [Parasponia andersonii]
MKETRGRKKSREQKKNGRERLGFPFLILFPHSLCDSKHALRRHKREDLIYVKYNFLRCQNVGDFGNERHMGSWQKQYFTGPRFKSTNNDNNPLPKTMHNNNLISDIWFLYHDEQNTRSHFLPES